MNWILKQLTGSLGPYILGVLAIALIGLSVTTKVLWLHNDKLRGDLAVANANIESLKSVNTSNQEAIRKLQDANQRWSDLFKSQKDKDEQVAKDAQLYRERLIAASNARIDAIRKERQEPDCAAIMAIDIQRACPATAERMRADAARSSY